MAALANSTFTDEELVRAAREGSAAALDQLYRRHATAAWRTAHSITDNPWDAADAVSEAFLRVLGSLPSGRIPENVTFRPYLLRAVRNASIDQVRGRKPMLDDAAASSLETDRDDLPESLNERRTNTDLALDAFRNLPERQRTALWLTEVEGLSARDAAQILGVSANNASQLASRGRATLRRGFVQAHLRASVPDACRATVDRLGPLAMGTLSPAKSHAVLRHLNNCEECRARSAELDEVRSTLSKAAPALPLALAGHVLAAWQTAMREQLESLAAGAAGAGSAALTGAGAVTYKMLHRLRHLGRPGMAGGVASVGATAVTALAIGTVVFSGTGSRSGNPGRRPVGAAPPRTSMAPATARRSTSPPLTSPTSLPLTTPTSIDTTGSTSRKAPSLPTTALPRASSPAATSLSAVPPSKPVPIRPTTTKPPTTTTTQPYVPSSRWRPPITVEPMEPGPVLPVPTKTTVTHHGRVYPIWP